MFRTKEEIYEMLDSIYRLPSITASCSTLDYLNLYLESPFPIFRLKRPIPELSMS